MRWQGVLVVAVASLVLGIFLGGTLFSLMIQHHHSLHRRSALIQRSQVQHGMDPRLVWGSSTDAHLAPSRRSRRGNQAAQRRQREGHGPYRKHAQHHGNRHRLTASSRAAGSSANVLGKGHQALVLSKQERHARLKQLQQRVLRRLEATQFDPSAPILECNLGGGCGFGCMAHRVAACLNRALERNCTLFARDMLGTYKSSGPDCSGWDCFFEPVRKPLQLGGAGTTGAHNSTVQRYTLSKALTSKEAFDHPLPAFVREGVEALYPRRRDARLWYVGQLVGWLLRPNARMQRILEAKTREIGLSLPVDFAVHIRMTDKLKKEAKPHCWREYFLHVDHFLFGERQYWHTMHGFTPNTTAFVATDDPSIFAPNDRTSLSAWRHNRVFWNPKGAKLANSMTTRSSRESLENLLAELYIMASASHLVGTFTSQVSRLVAELKMFQGDFDILERTASLDDQWYGVL